MSDPFTIFLLLFLFFGTIIAATYYYKEKRRDYYNAIQGICPKCNKEILLEDKRSAGCCGPVQLSFHCEHCGYQNTFSSYDNGSCGC